MPQHNPKEYIKDYCHMSYIQDQERNNPNVSRYHMDWCEYDYSYYLDIYKRFVAIALVLYSEEEKKFVFHSNLREVCPRNTKPKYLFGFLEENGDYRCSNVFVFFKIGKLGHVIDSSRFIVLKMKVDLGFGDFASRDRIDFDGNAITTISKISETQIEFHFSYYYITKMNIELFQNDIENTEIIVANGENAATINLPFFCNSAFDSTIVSPKIIRNGQEENILFDFGKHNMTSYIKMVLFRYSNENDQEIKDSISQNWVIDGKLILLVNQKNNEIFIMEYGGRNHQICEVIPPTIMEFSNTIEPHSINPIPFKNYFKFEPTVLDGKSYITACPLTSGKYLVLVYDSSSNKFINTKTFQDLFTSKIKWLLIDLDDKSCKRVYPRVYDLAHITSSSSDEFKTVRKKKRGGKGVVDSSFLDGDLNGGYSDVALISEIKPSTGYSTSDLTNSFSNEASTASHSSNIDRKPTSLIALPESFSLERAKLISFRPFPENPDIFHVQLSTAKYEKILNSMLPTVQRLDTYGHTFKFYFKFRDEAIDRHARRLLTLAKSQKFTDVQIK